MLCMKNYLFKLSACFLLMTLLALPTQARKKPTYEITLKINGCRDSMMYMGYYYAKGNSVVDTAYLDKKGCFVFTSTKDTLPEGLYFFANPKGNYVEFVVYHEKPFFTFETEQKDWTSNMKVKGSAQNEFFFEFHRADAVIDEDLAQKELTLDSAAFVKYKRQVLLKRDTTMIDYIKSNPNMFLSKMMMATKDEEPPLVDKHGDTMSIDQRRLYFLDHYFDNIPLDDNAIIRTPKKVFYDRVMDFFDKYLKYAPPQTIPFPNGVLL